MLFWVLAGLLAASVVYVLLAPLAGRGDAAPDSAAAYDVEIYKAQLREIERDLNRGVLTRAEADAARLEISRRLLAADARAQAGTPAPARAQGWVKPLAVAVALFAPLGGVGLYLGLGAPGEPARPFAARDAERRAVAAEQAEVNALRRQAASLAAELAERPYDTEGWRRLAGMYMATGDFGRAADAFRRARTGNPAQPALIAAEAEALVAGENGTVGEQAEALFNWVLELDPGNPRARFYLAVGDYQAGRRERALEAWAGLRADSPADAGWQPILEERIRMTAAEIGADPAAYLPDPLPAGPAPAPGLTALPPGPAARGPTAEDMAAAAEMSPRDRQAMIEGMVASLAERLAEDPDDLEGWLRLIRAYMVQDRPEDARAAFETAFRALGEDPRAGARLIALGREFSLLPETLSVPVGPTAADLDAQRARPLDTRREALADPVSDLESWLEDNPDSVVGWVRLSHAYQVLERPGAERDALIAALDLDPENPFLLRALGRAAWAAADGELTETGLDAMRRLLAIDPDDLEANWVLAIDRLRDGDRDAARRYFDRALSTLPEDSQDRRELQAQADRLLGDG